MKTEAEVLQLKEKLLKAKETLSRISDGLYSDDMLTGSLMAFDLILERENATA